MKSKHGISLIVAALLVIGVSGCFLFPLLDLFVTDDGPIAAGITGNLGDPMPSLTADQLVTFNRGKIVINQRFGIVDGLGPAFNVTFCGACHERPTPGGSAGLYRNFFPGRSGHGRRDV